MFFIIEKKNENKIAICKSLIFFKAEEKLSILKLCKHLGISSVTIRNLIKEINEDLGKYMHVKIKNSNVYLSSNNYTIEQVVDYYCQHDIGYKILTKLLLTPNVYTIELLAKSLFVSNSNLYKIIKIFNKRLLPCNLSLILDSGIYLQGSEKMIRNLLFELINSSPNLNKQLNFRPNKNVLRRQVNIIFATYNIVPTPFNVNSFSNWILTCLNWNYISNKKSILIVDEKNDTIPIVLDTEALEIGAVVIKDLGKSQITTQEIKILYLGLANIVLKFSSSNDALLFHNHFIVRHSISSKTSSLIHPLKELITNEEKINYTNFSLDDFVIFIINFISYFFISWRKNIELHQYIYDIKPSNYDKVKELCEQYLELDNKLVKDTYVQLFCLMINYYQLYTDEDILANKKFIYESILGNNNRTLMLSKIQSLFDTSKDYPNLEYLYIVDDIRLTKDSNKKYILLQDFLNYLNELF